MHRNSQESAQELWEARPRVRSRVRIQIIDGSEVRVNYIPTPYLVRSQTSQSFEEQLSDRKCESKIT